MQSPKIHPSNSSVGPAPGGDAAPVAGLMAAESERLFRSTFDALTSNVAILDEGGRVLAVNRAWREFAAANCAILDRVGPGADYLALCDQAAAAGVCVAGEFARGIRQVIAGKIEEFAREYDCHSPEERRWFLGRVTRFSGDGPPRVVVVHENLSPVKQAEEALLRSEQDLVEAQAIAHLGSYSWDMLTGRLQWSAELRRIWGVESPLSFRQIRRHIHPEDAVGVISRGRQALAREDEFESEYRIVRPDGQVRFLHDRARIHRDGAGRALRMFGTVLDITERRAAEEGIRKLSRAVEQSPVAIVITDATGAIEYVNPRFTHVTGFSLAEVRGANPRILKSGKNDPAVYRDLWTAITSGREWRGELHNRKKNGELFWEFASISPIFDDVGRITHFLAVKEDITAVKLREAQQLRAQRLESLGALASGVAHDLNNVLTPVMVGVEALALDGVTAAQAETLQMIQDAARRGAGIVRQLLLFGRGSDAPKVEMSLHEVFYEFGQMLHETFPRNLTIAVSAAEDLWPVKGDATQLHQVLLNLCVNARDAMPDGGALTVTAENLNLDEGFIEQFRGARSGPHVVVRVIDSGCGIDAENLTKVFDPFYTTKPVGHGTGLGLPTVLGIVKGHGGFVDLRSRPGFGTEFAIYLPALPQAGPAPAKPAAPRLLRGEGECLLLVDDEPAVRLLLQQVLTRENYEVLTAGDGAEGIALFAQNASRIRAVVTDLMMPVMDGVQMIRGLRRMAPEVPLIALSGLHGQGVELQKEGYRRLRLLAKPFATERLLALLRDVLAEPSDAASERSNT
ncbi:MAG: PAS domain S-box protein [Verrucomicrobia bacterium]|nr:PAS domain S-box protein [Verrucomicrobiota bacterium]